MNEAVSKPRAAWLNPGWYAAFLLLVFAGDRVAGYYFRQQAYQSQLRYSRLYRTSEVRDILLLGNSRGLTFYQPYLEEITGKSTLNLSYNGLPMDAGKCLVMDYLDRYTFNHYGEPQILLIDITMCDRENDELLAGFLTYAHRSERLDTLIHSKIPKVWWGGQVSWLFRCNNEIFQRALYHQNRPDKDWLLDREIAPGLADEVSKHSYDLDIQPYLVRQLKETVAAAQAAGVKVTLLIGPYFPGFQVKNLDALKYEVEKATGLGVHDYRAALTQAGDFGDFMHPNKQGSKKYLDLLKRDGLFEF